MWRHRLKILSALSCSLSILLFRDLLQNMKTKGQYENWESKNDFIKILIFVKDKMLDNLARINNFIPAFLKHL